MTVVRADATLIPLRDASVDLIITSPPYFALRSYRDGDTHYAGQIGSEPTPAAFVAALLAATAEMVRVLKPSGSIFVNLGDKYAGSGGHNNSGINTERYYVGLGIDESRNAPPSYNKNADVGGATIRSKSLMGLPWRYALGAVDQLGLILRAEIIWSKPNGLPESVTDRVRRSHEQWFHFTRQGRYFSAVDEVREPQLYPEHSQLGKSPNGRRGVGVDEAVAGNRLVRDVRTLHPLGKLPGSVWTIPSEPLIVPAAVQAHYNLPDHFAAFPQEWPRRLILGWSPSGICTVCGEGRRPVVEKKFIETPTPRGRDYRDASVAQMRGEEIPENARLLGCQSATITGYACACDVPLAKTRPAVVLDPFGGTGTVAMVARALGRTGINLDLSSDYCRLARWRIHHSGHAAKSEERTWRDAQGAML